MHFLIKLVSLLSITGGAAFAAKISSDFYEKQNSQLTEGDEKTQPKVAFVEQNNKSNNNKATCSKEKTDNGTEDEKPDYKCPLPKQLYDKGIAERSLDLLIDQKKKLEHIIIKIEHEIQEYYVYAASLLRDISYLNLELEDKNQELKEENKKLLYQNYEQLKTQNKKLVQKWYDLSLLNAEVHKFYNTTVDIEGTNSVDITTITPSANIIVEDEIDEKIIDYKKTYEEILQILVEENNKYVQELKTFYAQIQHLQDVEELKDYIKKEIIEETITKSEQMKSIKVQIQSLEIDLIKWKKIVEELLEKEKLLLASISK